MAVKALTTVHRMSSVITSSVLDILVDTPGSEGRAPCSSTSPGSAASLKVVWRSLPDSDVFSGSCNGPSISRMGAGGVDEDSVVGGSSADVACGVEGDAARPMSPSSSMSKEESREGVRRVIVEIDREEDEVASVGRVRSASSSSSPNGLTVFRAGDDGIARKATEECSAEAGSGYAGVLSLMSVSTSVFTVGGASYAGGPSIPSSKSSSSRSSFSWSSSSMRSLAAGSNSGFFTV